LFLIVYPYDVLCVYVCYHPYICSISILSLGEMYLMKHYNSICQ